MKIFSDCSTGGEFVRSGRQNPASFLQQDGYQAESSLERCGACSTRVEGGIVIPFTFEEVAHIQFICIRHSPWPLNVVFFVTRENLRHPSEDDTNYFYHSSMCFIFSAYCCVVRPVFLRTCLQYQVHGAMLLVLTANCATFCLLYSVSQQLGNLQMVSQAWQQFEIHLSELQGALRSDQNTLRMLDSALQGGTVSPDVATSVRDVAKVLSEKQDSDSDDILCQVSHNIYSSVTGTEKLECAWSWPTLLQWANCRGGWCGAVVYFRCVFCVSATCCLRVDLDFCPLSSWNTLWVFLLQNSAFCFWPVPECSNLTARHGFFSPASSPNIRFFQTCRNNKWRVEVIGRRVTNQRKRMHSKMARRAMAR